MLLINGTIFHNWYQSQLTTVNGVIWKEESRRINVDTITQLLAYIQNIRNWNKDFNYFGVLVCRMLWYWNHFMALSLKFSSLCIRLVVVLLSGGCEVLCCWSPPGGGNTRLFVSVLVINATWLTLCVVILSISNLARSIISYIDNLSSALANSLARAPVKTPL